MTESLQNEPELERDGLWGQMAGEYRIGRRLGEGGFGAVYEAVHPVLQRRAAVKVLHRSAGVNSDEVRRFMAEARAANQIRSRFIIDIFSFGQLPNGRHFYVMELLEGLPLNEYLARFEPLEPSLVLAILRPIAEALDLAHAAGIVHRDLKPQNVFLAWEAGGEVVPKLLDFGIAKLADSSSVRTTSGRPLGTPLYMSPEQCRGEKADARSDVYAFGVLCHEMLTAGYPVMADNSAGLLFAHVFETPVLVSAARPALGDTFDEPVLRMLAKQPDARPPSAGAAFEALRNAAARAGIELPSGLPRLPPPSPSRPPSELPESSRTPATERALEPLERAATEPAAMLSPQPVGDMTARHEPPRSRRSSLLFGLVVLLGLGALLTSVVPRLWRAPTDGSDRLLGPATASAAPARTPTTSLPSSVPAPSASVPAPAKLRANPATIELRIGDAPEGASVSAGQRRLGAAPGPITLPYGETPLAITVAHPGYASRTVSFVPSSSVELAVPLTRLTPRSRAAAATPRDFEDPFR